MMSSSCRAVLYYITVLKNTMLMYVCCDVIIYIRIYYDVVYNN